METRDAVAMKAEYYQKVALPEGTLVVPGRLERPTLRFEV